MAWTAPRTWVVGELVTAAIMNTFIRDNQISLKTDLAKCTVTERAYAMATNYQNTTGGVIIVCVSVDVGAVGQDFLFAKVGVASPAATIVSKQDADGTEWSRFIQVTFVVPDDWFHRLDDTVADFGIVEWIEYELHS